MAVASESEFERKVIEALQKKGWEKTVLEYPTEEQLVDNWAQILFENNQGIDRLGDAPLTKTEMAQILDQIQTLRSPLRLNGFINGKTVSITRDNPADPAHLGKEVSLKIYDRHEIAAGQSRYQIAQQPRFKASSRIVGDRRGDLMLLINGMPVIHIELKKSGIPVSQACNQIEKYVREGIFTGIFSLIQVFVASNPEETVYFANPGPDGKFNSDYYFHWADFNNEPVNHWSDVVSALLAIPMAHQLIGFYTVADDTDGVLKVMRSYQYFAANRISDRVARIDWDEGNQRGGFIWHTTGSGKTMTSFKSAQLIASSHDADKVVFLMDRIELGTQSLMEYRGFADKAEEVQATEDTGELIVKLKSSSPSDTLIVTSIQKMSRVSEEKNQRTTDIHEIASNRLVFVVDEAHRSTFGDMLTTIKSTFPRAVFFGFTGTPIHEENKKKNSTTSDIFGDELHRYSIADGIRDKNVLGFDPYRVEIFPAQELRKAVALEQAHASTDSEVHQDENKEQVFYQFMNSGVIPQAGYKTQDGRYHKGIEDYVPSNQYEQPSYREKVVDDVLKNWLTLSRNSKFHALLATSSIPEAIEYYRLFKQKKSPSYALKVAVLIDPNIDNRGNSAFKEDGLIEILEDYNRNYEQDYTLASWQKYKKDIAARLAHKKPYDRMKENSEQRIDLLIVVDQMLTGFDSKWINTLYLDKVLRYETIIQAFSRTNRLCGPEKPFGTIRYYRKPATMQQRIEQAFELYSGNKPLGLFVEKLDKHLNKLNSVTEQIILLFENAGIKDFNYLPDDIAECGQFAKLFSELNDVLEAAQIQGFTWSQDSYDFKQPKRTIVVTLDEQTYLTFAMRYKELERKTNKPDEPGADIPFDIKTHLTEIDTGRIDAEYMNSRFKKYLKALRNPGVDSSSLHDVLDELYSSFASLTQEQQRFANMFLHDVQNGDIQPGKEKTILDYITEYELTEKDQQINKLVDTFGLDKNKLAELIDSGVDDNNLNEYGRFDTLKATIDEKLARNYFNRTQDPDAKSWKWKLKIEKILKDYILHNEFPTELTESQSPSE